MSKVIATQRLLLRRWREEDRAPFAEMNADPRVMEFLPAPLDRTTSDALIDRIENDFDQFGYGLWAVELSTTGKFIGFTGLTLQTFDAAFTPAVEVGWRLARHAWGHGYATEAAQAAVKFGFDQVGLREIVSMTTVANTRSRNVMRRLGMTHDPAEDFEHPRLPTGHPLRQHVLFRLSKAFKE